MLPFLDPVRDKGATLWPGQCLRPGEYLRSPDSQYYLLFQAQDGNLVLYRSRDFQPIWSRRTSQAGVCAQAKVTMQANGNLLLSCPGSPATMVAWPAEAPAEALAVCNQGAYAELRNDGRLVVCA